jgi:hypothetical protein
MAQTRQIQLNVSNFSEWVQEINKRYYLKPMSESAGHQFKDGARLYRTDHGAMHASRTALWAAVMHHFLQDKINLQYVNDAIQKAANRLNVTPNEALLLTYLTMACHDAARQGEGVDLWEKASSEIAAQILQEVGLPAQEANWLATAVLHKDDSDQYNMNLLRSGIPADDLAAFEYLRILISLGDHLDIIRCKDRIELAGIFETLALSIPGFKAFDDNNHDQVIALIKGIYRVLNEQGDIRPLAQLTDTNGQPIEVTWIALGGNEKWHRKRQYEHADNVFNLMLEDALQSTHPEVQPLKPYLQKVRQQLSPPAPTASAVPPDKTEAPAADRQPAPSLSPLTEGYHHAAAPLYQSSITTPNQARAFGRVVGLVLIYIGLSCLPFAWPAGVVLLILGAGVLGYCQFFMPSHITKQAPLSVGAEGFGKSAAPDWTPHHHRFMHGFGVSLYPDPEQAEQVAKLIPGSQPISREGSPALSSQASTPTFAPGAAVLAHQDGRPSSRPSTPKGKKK